MKGGGSRARRGARGLCGVSEVCRVGGGGGGASERC